MSNHVRPVPEDFARRASVDAARYAAMYEASIRDPGAFWGEHGRRMNGIEPYTRVKATSFARDAVSIEWFGDGRTNTALNRVDRYLATRADRIAMLWECDNPKDSRAVTYRELQPRIRTTARPTAQTAPGMPSCPPTCSRIRPPPRASRPGPPRTR